MRTIYLVDYLGIHCGMHYYLEAFKKVLEEIDGVHVIILSNYSDRETDAPFFVNQYKGSKFNKILSLLKNLFRLQRIVTSKKNDIFVYLTYGNRIDLLFMNIISKVNNHVIDIHEAIAQNFDSMVFLKNRFKDLYGNKIRNVISHSSRTNSFLADYKFRGHRFNVPHFKYTFSKIYNESNINYEIKDSIDSSKLNLLFFGNLNESKGIDILLKAYNLTDSHTANKINLIIAGKDFDGAIDRVEIKSDRKVKIFKRHITDDELRFLYQHVDYLCLPYRKTSQSGILEMAFYFQKPIIASDVLYFRQTLNQFPSFGILAGTTEEDYAKAMKDVVNKHAEAKYFIEEDYKKYIHRTEIEKFKIDFGEWIDKIS